MPEAIDFEHKTDEELVELTLGNQEYFVWIIRRYKEKLFKYVMRLTNIDQEDAEDILQEVFMKAYFNLNDFNTDLKFSSWIYRITHNQVISNFRKLKARAEGNKIDLSDDGAQRLGSDLDIEKEMDRIMLKEEVNKAISSLDTKYREVLILKYIEEKNYQEISDIIRKPIGTVGSLINKAKQELKEKFKHTEYSI